MATICWTITTGEAVQIFGLLLDLAGIYLLTISNLFGQQNGAVLWYLLRGIDRDKLPNKEDFDPQEYENSDRYGDRFPKPPKSHVSGASMPGPLPPAHQQAYDTFVGTTLKRVVGVWLLIIGFATQIVGTAI